MTVKGLLKYIKQKRNLKRQTNHIEHFILIPTDVNEHSTLYRWFQGFDWVGLDRRDINTPLKRKVLSAFDVSNFDRYPGEINLPPDETSGWDEDF